MKQPLINAESRFDAVILASGDFPSHKIPLDILCHERPLIVCDDAIVKLEAFNRRQTALSIEPMAIVGDGDSIPAELQRKYANIWHQIDEQDDNDLTKATKYLLERHSVSQIAYLGATGKREDHTLGNIALLPYYKRVLGIRPTMITDYGYFIPASGETTFESFEGQQVSIFNFSCRHLEGKGLKWAPFTFQELWQGTLNEAVGNEFVIRGDGEYLIYRTFEKKQQKDTR